MKEKIKPPHTIFFSQAEKLAAITLLLAILLFQIAAWIALIPLFLFLLLYLMAPFFPQWEFFLPIISKSITDSKAVALTFDDGPSPLSTPFLLNVLDHFNFKATFFVIGKKAEKYPDLMADILAGGHTIANHSWQHDNLLMLRSKKRLEQDIKKTQDVLKSYGVQTLLFRPPVGITNPRLKSVLQNENLLTVTFSCRPFDRGNKIVTNLAERVLSRLKPGDIILLHDIAPETENKIHIWHNEIETLFADLQRSTYEVEPLETLIGSPVMIYIES
ncbi:MAG: polysaccharide deacetylase family protein [Thermodesulfobacteriota bacterium]|nr:polysaccharide deacetylase family protein [Thermodesulfobacteriota bacterium]